MGYAKEFNHLFYNVPDFLLKDHDWEDVSWHNDVCPRFENKKLMVAVWVAENEPSLREFDEWKQYVVVGLLEQDGETILANDDLFQTDSEVALFAWLSYYATMGTLQKLMSYLNSLDKPTPTVADATATALASLQDAVQELIRLPETPIAGTSTEHIEWLEQNFKKLYKTLKTTDKKVPTTFADVNYFAGLIQEYLNLDSALAKTAAEWLHKFERFQATGKDVDSIGAHTNDEDESGVPGRIYMDILSINLANDPTHGKWFLHIGNCQYTTDDLEELELILFIWANGEILEINNL